MLFYKAQNHITVSILVRWQNITLETFMLAIHFTSHVYWEKGEEGEERVRQKADSNSSRTRQKLLSFKHLTHAQRPVQL